MSALIVKIIKSSEESTAIDSVNNIYEANGMQFDIV